MDHKLKTFVAIGSNVWGGSNDIYSAIKEAHSYTSGDGRFNRYVVYLVSGDFSVSGIDGSISATELHKIGYFNAGGQVLKGRD